MSLRKSAQLPAEGDEGAVVAVVGPLPVAVLTEGGLTVGAWVDGCAMLVVGVAGSLAEGPLVPGTGPVADGALPADALSSPASIASSFFARSSSVLMARRS